MTDLIEIKVNNFVIANDRPFVLIAGPCLLEGKNHALEMSSALIEITSKLGISFIYKTSFDKANRTSLESARGLGIDESLPILAEVREKIGCPVLTDVHLPEQCERVAGVVDVLQIPAFLCRQTDLIMAASRTGNPINIKKGQFLAPWDMENVVQKAVSVGNNKVMVCERGVSFGYNTLVSDMRSIPILSQNGRPVIYDATHSVQQPGGRGTSSGGQREFVPILARAAAAIGVAGIFMETHQDPDKAPSDGPNMISIKALPSILKTLIELDRVAKDNPVKI
ncbi:MAG: 3-deoxy-8-phosphooctulonate synthase [Pseudomonadota bacterium]|nr:3-deoxy-8-phosphooctulonate synthase [Pseudomonadota bacterium]